MFLLFSICDSSLYVIRIRELYKKLGVVVRLRAVVPREAADGATVSYDEAAAGIGFYGYRLHKPAALRGTVAGVDIDMERAEASRAMIARTVAERLNLKPAVFADERVVVFCKKLLLRISHLRIFFSIYYATKKAFCQVFHLTFRHDCAILQV